MKPGIMALRRLAHAHGIHTVHRAGQLVRRTASVEALLATLRSLGVPVAGIADTPAPSRRPGTPEPEPAPCRVERAPAGAHRLSALPGAESEPARSCKILIAEDVPADQCLARSILEQRGHQVTLARDGREALAADSADSFDVILVDVKIPVVDGLQAAVAIRELEKQSNRRTPIVAMTGLAGPGDRERCLAAGMDTVIGKPILDREMVDVVERLAAESSSDSNARIDTRPPDARVVDLSATLERLEGNVDLVRDLIGLFLDDRDKLVQAIEGAIERESGDDLCRTAHRLKGLVANFDAEGATRTTFRLESMARVGDLTDARPTLECLKEQLAEVTRALESYLSRPGG